VQNLTTIASAVPGIWLVVGTHQNLNSSRDLATHAPFRDDLSSLAAINLLTKFKVSVSTDYEDMKSDTKCRKWGGLG